MTETLEGVRDPLRVDPGADNAVLVFALFPKGYRDLVCGVDADGVVRHPEKRHPMPWASYSVEAVDVDPETWGDHYHHPDDCGEGGRFHCDGCTVAAEREHDREHYRSGVSEDFDAEEFKEDLEAALGALEAQGWRP